MVSGKKIQFLNVIIKCFHSISNKSFKNPRIFKNVLKWKEGERNVTLTNRSYLSRLKVWKTSSVSTFHFSFHLEFESLKHFSDYVARKTHLSIAKGTILAAIFKTLKNWSSPLNLAWPLNQPCFMEIKNANRIHFTTKWMTYRG